ncbi:protein kinase domain-containing protein [Nonomuraea angiospora]|uniref:protein kinase domain-containing protein n=1 Tax=Nonomuraea angiospora TaxID=46172 RepID=UPI0029BE033F|nr:protein kinase [Nonomuraea angiospora]MDX3111564.1 protein kinase [Nonomuraea angiospora]
MTSLVGGRYRLIEPVGEGGMGVVWRARDESLGREVAVKRVRLAPGLDAASRAALCDRALAEARTAAALRHPSIVAVHDLIVEDRDPAIVIELVHGPSLEQVIRENGPLPARRAAEIGLRVLSALAATHAAGVLHRDVKPANVLLAGDGRVVLTDFGIATLVGGLPGTPVGTPGYTAPECLHAPAPDHTLILPTDPTDFHAAAAGRPSDPTHGHAIDPADGHAADPTDGHTADPTDSRATGPTDGHSADRTVVQPTDPAGAGAADRTASRPTGPASPRAAGAGSDAWSGAAGPASDLWSLAAALYTAVEGRGPFARDSAVATLSAVLTEPPAPSGSALWPVLAAALEKDPHKRPGAERLRGWLEAVVQGPAATAVLPEPPRDTPPGVRLPVALGALVVAALVGAGAVVVPQLGRTSAAGPAAVAAAPPATAEAGRFAALPRACGLLTPEQAAEAVPKALIMPRENAECTWHQSLAKESRSLRLELEMQEPTGTHAEIALAADDFDSRRDEAERSRKSSLLGRSSEISDLKGLGDEAMTWTVTDDRRPQTEVAIVFRVSNLVAKLTLRREVAKDPALPGQAGAAARSVVEALTR